MAMSCKDILDTDFLLAVAVTPHPGLVNGGAPWRLRWEVQAELEKVYGPIPEKLFLAKARKLGRKRLLAGCTECSCRGDYHLWGECFDEKWCCPRPWDWENQVEVNSNE